MDIDVELLADGTVRFARWDKERNACTYEIVSDLVPSKKEEIKEFLEGSEEIERVLGNDVLCG